MLFKLKQNMVLKVKIASSLCAAALVVACQEQPFEDPPIHPNLNMDFQEAYKPQEGSNFFADGRAMRPLVPGTVARGFLKEDDHFYKGLVNGQPAQALPPQVKLTKELLKRGQQRYNIVCAPCHDSAGTGKGTVALRAPISNMPNFHSDQTVKKNVGEVYGIISNGFGRMPAYSWSVPYEDRWAIASYMKALQLSRRATLDQVPQDIAKEKGWAK
jgi:mono/diheme cytochrome c family protein